MVSIIAEIGINHGGSVEMARAMIAAAASAGADVVKFQMFNAEALDPPGERREMLRRCQLPVEAWRPLARDCSAARVEFMCSPFDTWSLRHLAEIVGMRRIKIASGHLDNWPLLSAAKTMRKPVLLSTGMSATVQIAAALGVLDRERVTLLHCVSAYPCPDSDANLACIEPLKAFGCPVGYSDHTDGIEAAIGAVALGAGVIEKHFTLGRNAEGPDHAVSLEPGPFAEMVRAVRRMERMLGTGHKVPQPCEQPAVVVARERTLWRSS